MTDREAIHELICGRIRYYSEQEEKAEEAIYLVRWQERRVALEQLVQRIAHLPAPEQPVEQQEGKAEWLFKAITDVVATESVRGSSYAAARERLFAALKDIFGET